MTKTFVDWIIKEKNRMEEILKKETYLSEPTKNMIKDRINDLDKTLQQTKKNV